MRIDKEFWEKEYRRGEKIFSVLGHTRQNAVFRETLRHIDVLIRSHDPVPSRLRLLELGCGNSEWLCSLGTKYGFELFGIDYSETGCEMLARKLKRKNLSCTIFQKDILEMSSADIHKPVDLIFSSGLLEHFDRREALYDVSHRLLAENGFFMALVPNLNRLNLKWCRWADPELMNWHIPLKMPEMIEELRNNGFEEAQGKYIGGLRLFADSRNPLFAATKKAVNLTGELISRAIDVSCEALSPYFFLSAKKSLSSQS